MFALMTFDWPRCFSGYHWMFVIRSFFSSKAALYSKTTASRSLYQHATVINHSSFVSEFYRISRLWFLSLAHDQLLREVRGEQEYDFYPHSWEIGELAVAFSLTMLHRKGVLSFEEFQKVSRFNISVVLWYLCSSKVVRYSRSLSGSVQSRVQSQLFLVFEEEGYGDSKADCFCRN